MMMADQYNETFTQMSRRIDGLSDSVSKLENRMESNRIRTEDKLDEIIGTLATVKSELAKSELEVALGEKSAVKTQRHRELIVAWSSCIALILSLVATAAAHVI